LDIKIVKKIKKLMKNKSFIVILLNHSITWKSLNEEMKDGDDWCRNRGIDLLQLCKTAFNYTNRLMIRQYLSVHP